MDVVYADRLEAGRKLAHALELYRNSNAIVLGLARGGVEVGYAVADALNLPLQALVVRKVGAPQNSELALGAVSETGASWLDQELITAIGASKHYIDTEVARKRREAKERRTKYAVGPGPEAVRGRPAIVVDDGIARGATALVAVRSARELGASTVILATPVAAEDAVEVLKPQVDELVVLGIPYPFFAVGLFYREFEQVSDDEVVRYLRLAQSHRAVAGSSP
jgi:putative phosphoribosyl transferase